MERIESITQDSTRTVRFTEPDEEVRGGSFGYIIYPDGEVVECVGEEALRLPIPEETHEFGDDPIPF